MQKGCQIAPIDGRGLGVLAERPLAFGAVLCVAPLFVAGETVEATLRAIIRSQIDGWPDAERMLRACMAFCPDDADQALESASAAHDGYDQLLAQLPTEARRTLAIRSLASARDLRILSLRLSRNGFVDGVFPDACRFNHSCRPNCLFFTRTSAAGTSAAAKTTAGNMAEGATAPGALELVVVAGEDVPEGAELTISYLPEARWHLPTDQRRLLLQRQYGFHCLCARCHRPKQPASVRHAERALEAMRCARCNGQPLQSTLLPASAAPRNAAAPVAPEPAAGAPAGQEARDARFGLAGAHVPLDEHEAPSGERIGGYTPCTQCGTEGNEPALDQALIRCHAHVSAAARAGAAGTLQATRSEFETLRGLLADGGEGTALFPTHWLLCEIHWRLQATSSALLQGAAAEAERRELLRAHAEHSLALVLCLELIIPCRSHLMAALCSRAADALDGLAAVEQRGGAHAAALASRAPERGGFQALAVLREGEAAMRACTLQLREVAAPVLRLL
jgi:hypothetical protein